MNQGVEILIAEDSPTQAAQLQHILEAHDYSVRIAENGQRALDMMRAGECAPSLVISDIMMPEMDGYTLCCEVKKDRGLKEIPVMLLTSLSDPTDIIRGLECGADNFLTKPYDERQLLARVQYILLNREMRREGRTRMGMEVFFGGQRLVVTPERQQILDLLISAYETAVQKNLELQRVQEELKALTERLEEEVEERTRELTAEIAERKQAEEALTESEQRYRMMGEGILHQVWTAQPDGKLDYVNGRTLRYFGRTAEEMLGEGWQNVVHPDDLPACAGRWARSLATGEPYEVEFRLRRADGAYRWHLGRATAGRDADGRIIKWFGTSTDIDDQKTAEASLRSSEEQLRQSQKLEAVGQLAGGIAHDFNNLLTVINGNSDLLLRGISDEKQSERVHEIKKAGERAAQLTRQFLAFSRKQVLQPVVLDLNTVIPDTDKMLRRLIGADVDFLTALEPELWQVRADPGQIEQVLMNLAINARDAMPKGGKLTIQTANVHLDEAYARRHAAVRPGPYVMLAVSDTGHGMDAETQKRIFEPFFTTKEKGKGTGLGLSTVYGIVKQSGGHVWVYSEVGRGTTFKVYLPRVAEAADTHAQVPPPAAAPQGSETVLLAEDEEVLRKLARDILELSGYHVLAATDCQNALSLCERHEGPIHLLLTDVVMPQMSGRELAERARALRPAMRVLYMSGYTDDSIVHHGVLDAGVAFLEKPFTPDAMARKVREVLDDAPGAERAETAHVDIANRGSRIAD